MTTVKKLGRPKSGEEREKMGTITFSVTDEVRAALRTLETALPAGTVGRRSVVLRRLILEALEKGKTS